MVQRTTVRVRTSMDKINKTSYKNKTETYE